MTGWMKALLIGGASAAGVAVVATAVYFGLPYLTQKTAPAPLAAVTSSTSPDFTKTAYQVDSSGNLILDSSGNPVPFAGPPHPGDQVEYVLTYKEPTGGASGPVTITDTLSGNQSYVDPSIQAPPGWTYPTSPGYPGNAETYSNPGFGPGSGFTMNIAPIGPAIGNAGNSTGDGFQPIPVASAGRVYSVWHHKPDDRNGDGFPDWGGIMCWNLSDLSPCAGYSKLFNASGGGDLLTPNWPHAVVVGSKFYFPAGREQANNTTADAGIGCWDTTTDASCPFIPLPGNPTFPHSWSSPNYISSMYGGTSSTYFAGVVTDPAQPAHVIANVNNQLYCVDTTTATACAAWASSPPLSGATQAGQVRDMIAETDAGGTRVFVEYNGATASARLACRLLANGANCPGWPLIGGSSEVVLAAKTSAYMTLSPVPAGSGLVAVCAHQALQGAPACVKTADGSPYAMPAVFTTAGGQFNGTDNTYVPNAATLHARYVIAAFQLPGTQQVLYPYYITRAQPYCFDFATNAACAGFNAVWNSNNNNPVNPILNDSRDYGYAADPTDPENCLLGLGDHEILWRFRRDGAMGRGVCTQQHVQKTFDINAPFCAKKPKEATWTNVEIVGRPAELVGGTIVVKDQTGTVVQTITVSSANAYTMNLPATGNNSTLTVEFIPNYGTNTPPTTAYQLKLNYTADVDPQICYRVTVKDCNETLTQGPVTNTAIYTNAKGTNQATVNLGNVTGGHCGPPPCLLDLTGVVTMNPNGTGTLTISGSGPPGFNAHILNVHSNTAGVTVTPPTRTVPPGPINTTFVLTGFTPGQSVDMQIDAVDPGAGTNGSDKCCSSTITVIVPDGHQHHHTDVAIQKTGASEGQGPANGSGYIYTLSVTNVSDPINGQNNVVVTDVVPAGLSFANASGTDWNCAGPFPIGSGGTLTCTYTDSGTVATGQVLPPITVVSTNATAGTQLPSVTNCARVAFTSASGLTDYQPSNDQSCVTNDAHSQTGSLKVIKTVVPARGHTVPPISFQANVICTPLGGSGTTTSLTLGSANSYTQTISNLTAGTVCTISETPPSPTGLTKDCHWVTTYPDGQQATIPAGTVTAHITNTEVCSDVTPTDTAVRITKKVVIDGRVSYPPYQSFPIRATCKTPDGASLDLSYTASAAAGFSTPRQKAPEGSKCTIREPQPLPPPGRDRCHWTTRYLFNDRPVHGFPVTLPNRPLNSFEVENSLTCDQTQTPTQTDSEDRCTAPSHWNGKRCVRCEGDTTWNEEAGVCRTPPSNPPSSKTCSASMELNAAGECTCPKGTKLKDGECLKSSSWFNKVLDNVTIGVGTSSGGHSDGPKPKK